jgi:hypothetical protein
MIYAELCGGLGNQMFVYAFARALGLQNGEPVTLIDRQDGGPAHTVCGLGELALSPGVRFVQGADYAKKHLPVANACKVLAIRHEQRGGMMDHTWHDYEVRRAPFFNAAGLHFATDGYVPCRRGKARDMLLYGYFQSEAYFAAQRDAVRAELRTKTPPDAAGQALAAQIDAAAQPVCMHVRRGDYQNPENAALQVCTPEYYTRAAAWVRKILPQAQLFIFSDDLPWAQALLDTAGLPTVFALGARSAAQELALMQRCRHFVLSNSTFSWWAQYLGDAPHKMVFAPSRWYANQKQTALYQKDWKLIRV